MYELTVSFVDTNSGFQQLSNISFKYYQPKDVILKDGAFSSIKQGKSHLSHLIETMAYAIFQ